MAYAWSRYIFVHCFQTRTDFWELLSFVEGGMEGGKLEKPPENPGRKDENEQQALSHALNQPCCLISVSKIALEQLGILPS